MRMARVLGYVLTISIMGTPGIFAQDRGQGRSMVISRGGIVAAESPLAAQAGVRMLESGGNAVDAAIATNAMMGVVEPMMNGIGGDLFAIVYDAKANKLYGLNASGRAPKALTIEFLQKQGLREMLRCRSGRRHIGLTNWTCCGATKRRAKSICQTTMRRA